MPHTLHLRARLRVPISISLLRSSVLLALSLYTCQVNAASLDATTINDAQWSDRQSTQKAMNPMMVKLQVLLDRAHFSPGEIDGKAGENVNKAVAAYGVAQGLETHGLTKELWEKLSGEFTDPVIVEHKLTNLDIKGPFADKIPTKMEDMKDLPALSYTGPKEKLAEHFHMSVELLESLNRDQDFDRVGDTIMVAKVSNGALPEKATRIEIDKSRQTLKVFGKSGFLLAVYPVTVGSTEKPAPNGELKVTSVARNPTYRYNPDYAFKGVRSRDSFVIKPGPNNPVGLVWIGLNKEGYGIHGTPEPSKVSKSESHGCIRLTNWDALQLASAVTKGTKVDFIGEEKDARAKSTRAKNKSRRRR